MRCSTMAEAEATPMTPAETDYFARYQSFPVPARATDRLSTLDSAIRRSMRGATPLEKKNEKRRREGKESLIDTRNMPREERNAIPAHRRMVHRGLGRHWEDRQFKAKFEGYSFKWNPVTNEQERFIVLTDVYMDGALLTMNWSMPELSGLRRFCTQPGSIVEFQCWFNRGGIEAKTAGQPVIRGPFQNVK